MVILTGWNEWIAQRFDYQGRVAFVDAFTVSLNRDIEPGGTSGDLYYNLMKDLITQYRGNQPFVFEDYFLTEHSIFDASYYYEAHADLQQVFSSDDHAGLRNHWLTVGKFEGRRPSVVFDANHYRNAYPALAAANLTTPEALLRHFIDFGFQEGRQGSSDFLASAYIDRHPEVSRLYGSNGFYKAYKYYVSVGQFANHNLKR